MAKIFHQGVTRHQHSPRIFRFIRQGNISFQNDISQKSKDLESCREVVSKDKKWWELAGMLTWYCELQMSNHVTIEIEFQAGVYWRVCEYM